MTVKELREALEKLPDNAEVFMLNYDRTERSLINEVDEVTEDWVNFY